MADAGNIKLEMEIYMLGVCILFKTARKSIKHTVINSQEKYRKYKNTNQNLKKPLNWKEISKIKNVNLHKVTYKCNTILIRISKFHYIWFGLVWFGQN